MVTMGIATLALHALLQIVCSGRLETCWKQALAAKSNCQDVTNNDRSSLGMHPCEDDESANVAFAKGAGSC
jgi:hypothetical protein